MGEKFDGRDPALRDGKWDSSLAPSARTLASAAFVAIVAGSALYAFRATPLIRAQRAVRDVDEVHASPSAIFFIVPRRILPERVLGRRATVIASLECRHRPDPLSHQADDLLLDRAGRPVDARLSTMKPQGTSP